MSGPLETLRSSLWALRTRNCEGRFFIPRGSAQAILTRDRLRTGLAQAGIEPQHLDTTTRFILDGAQITFAVLLQIGEPCMIQHFAAADQLQGTGTDQSLPFRKGGLEFLPAEIAERFIEAQWAFAAPVFSRQFQHRNLDPFTILPFVSAERVGKGAFGVVHKIGIHPQHHDLAGFVHSAEDGIAWIARKQLLRDAPSQISDDAEQSMLAKLNCLKHGNLVEMLGSYRLQESLNLLFPLASASLSSYMASGEALPGFASESCVILALPGLASALQTLHVYRTEDVSLIGCHHDIKPDNILVLDGKFVLSDFGLSTLKDPANGSDTHFRAGQGFYFSPESEDYEDDFARRRIGRSSDIWSLGCVLLELMTFLSSGATGVAEFRQARKVTFGDFFTTATFHHGKMENPGVVRQFSKLRETAGQDASRDLVHLVEEMLRIDPAQRPTAEEVSRRMRGLALKHMLQLTINGFCRPSNMDIPFDLLLEEERLRIWGDTAIQSCYLSNNERLFNEAIQLLTELHDFIQPAKASQFNMHALATNLGRINDNLTALLDSKTQASLSKQLELRILSTDMSHSTIPPSTSHTPHANHEHIAMLLALQHALQLTQTTPDNLTPNQYQYHLPATTLYNLTPSPTEAFETARYIAPTSPPQDVLIQYLTYDSKWAGKTVGETLFARLNTLVDFLRSAHHMTSSSLCILECLGYIHKPSRHAFGLVFAFPTSPSPSVPPQQPKTGVRPLSLNTLILSTKNIRLRPDLGHIFCLAHKLAGCMLEWHSIGWLHKNFSSYQVVFFLSSKGRDFGVKKPYVVGFDSSRPDRPSEYSEGPKGEAIRVQYQHPMYRTGECRYRMGFDYWSLGCVLLELGLWKGLEEIIGSGGNMKGEEGMRFLVESVVPMLGPRMGGRYRDVVAACLGFGGGQAGQEEEEDRLGTLSRFREHVMDALGQCVV